MRRPRRWRAAPRACWLILGYATPASAFTSRRVRRRWLFVTGWAAASSGAPVRRRSWSGLLLRLALLAVGAEAPEGHLCLVDDEPVRLVGVQARGGAGHACDVLDAAAGAAH